MFFCDTVIVVPVVVPAAAAAVVVVVDYGYDATADLFYRYDYIENLCLRPLSTETQTLSALVPFLLGTIVWRQYGKYRQSKE